MIKQTIYKLTSRNTELNCNMSSLFHGWLMENVSPEFAGNMHESTLRPYSHHLEYQNKQWYWVVNTLNNSAADNILPVLSRAKSIRLKHNDTEISLSEQSGNSLSYDMLFERHYLSDSSPRIIPIFFSSPTSFKSGGKYINYPTVRLVFQSLINKYDSCSENTALYDENFFSELLSCTEIIGYNLKSTFFCLEGVKIPSFIGWIKIRTNGSKSMTSLVNMLAEFAKYSGIGIKCSLGMGGVRPF